MSREGKEALKTELRKHIASVAPGLLLSLDVYSLKMYGSRFVDVCVEDLEKCGSVLSEACKDKVVTEILLSVLIKKHLSSRESS